MLSFMSETVDILPDILDFKVQYLGIDEVRLF
jgi:hypothetical protein